MFTPAPDLVLFALARVPTAGALAGHQTRGLVLSAGVAYDW